MVSIRLSRVGNRNAPAFRVIAQESHRAPKSQALEILGSYIPRLTPKTIQLKAERIKYWMSKGAQTSDTVHNLLVSQGIITGKKKSVTTITAKRKVKLEKAKA